MFYTNDQLNRLGKIAHETYCQSANVKPVWNGLNPDIQKLWIDVAKEIIGEVCVSFEFEK